MYTFTYTLSTQPPYQCTKQLLIPLCSAFGQRNFHRKFPARVKLAFRIDKKLLCISCDNQPKGMGLACKTIACIWYEKTVKEEVLKDVYRDDSDDGMRNKEQYEGRGRG